MSQLRFAHLKLHSLGLGFFLKNSSIRAMLRRLKIYQFHSCATELRLRSLSLSLGSWTTSWSRFSQPLQTWCLSSSTLRKMAKKMLITGYHTKRQRKTRKFTCLKLLKRWSKKNNLQPVVGKKHHPVDNNQRWPLQSTKSKPSKRVQQSRTNKIPLDFDEIDDSYILVEMLKSMMLNQCLWRSTLIYRRPNRRLSINL